MFAKIVISLCLCALLLDNAQGTGLGDRLVRTALLYEPVPLNVDEATNDGWAAYGSNGCDPMLGLSYAIDGAPSWMYPITVYFTSAGQIAGIGMTHWGAPVPDLENYWVDQGDGSWYLSVSFRDTKDMCSGNVSPDKVGDRLVINAAGIAYSMPLTTGAATNQSFTEGGCIGGMGTHWSLDLDTAPVMSYNASNLMPVVAMYDKGDLSAFFITSPVLQYSEPFGPWEGPLPSSLMCYNWCGDNCNWNVDWWTVLHFFVHDPDVITCESHC